jgi:hypothetical protein
MTPHTRASLLLALAVLATAAAAGAQTPRSAAGDSRGWTPLDSIGARLPALARPVRVDLRGSTLGEAVRRILAAASVGLVYDPELPGVDRPLMVQVAGLRGDQALRELLRGSGLRLLFSAGGDAALVASPAGRAAERGIVSGTVRGSDGAAVVGARVVAGDRSAVTAADGRFTLGDLPAGRMVVEVRRLGFRTASAPVDVTPGSAAQVRVTLEPLAVPLAVVVVTPSYFGVMDHRSDAPSTLSREDLETRPQLGDDVFRAMNRIPGVAATDLSAAFHVRGGRNGEVLVLLDGLELVEPFHLKDFDGALSVVEASSLRGVDLITGGFGAEYGDRLTGVFDMRTVSPAPGPARTTLGVSLTNLRAMSSGSWSGGRGRWVGSARRGYLDLALGLARAREEGEGTLSPTYYDGRGKVEYDVAPGHTLAVHALAARDRLRFQDSPDDPELRSRYGSTYGWISWTARGDGVSLRTLASLSRLTWNRAGERTGEPALRVADARALRTWGIRHDGVWEISGSALAKWGVEARHGAASYDYFRSQPRGRAVDTVAADVSPEGAGAGVYGALRVRPAPALTLEGGVRYDRAAATGERHAAPRVSALVQLGPHTRVRGAWGRYVQAQGLQELQVQDGVRTFFPAEHAEHRVLGIEHSAGGAVALRAEAYQRRLSRVRPRFLNVDNPINDVFPEASPERVRFAPVRGQAEGIELQARRESGRRIAWAASYTLSRAEDLDSAGRWVPRGLDQRHAVALDGAWQPREGWRISGAWQYHTGWPASPLEQTATIGPDGTVTITRRWGPLNSARLPAYHRLDARISRQWTRRSGRVLAYLDLFNLYNRANARAIDPYVELRAGELVQGIRYDEMIPFLPSFGLSWEF